MSLVKMVPSDAISPLIQTSSGSSSTFAMLWKIRFTIFLLATHLFVLSLFLFRGSFHYNPYGIHPKATVGVLQIASAPIFIHNSKNWLLSILVHPIVVFASCLDFRETTGQITTVTAFSVLKLLRGL